MVHRIQNSNRLDQNIGLNKHKLILLVNDYNAECNVSQKKNYYEAVHDGAIGITETISDSAISMKSRFVGHCF